MKRLSPWERDYSFLVELPPGSGGNFLTAASLDRKRLEADFCAEGDLDPRRFRQEVRRKPLAFAADAWSYGI